MPLVGQSRGEEVREGREILPIRGLPQTEERQEKKKKKSGVQRSRSTQRSGLVSTPNVSFEVHKKQLFSGRRTGERRDIGK